MRTRILISINVIEAAADAVMDMPSTILISITYFGFILVTIAIWTLIGAW
jgi:hypothetical protein